MDLVLGFKGGSFLHRRCLLARAAYVPVEDLHLNVIQEKKTNRLFNSRTATIGDIIIMMFNMF